jgi:hypothetical protein
MPDAKYCSRSDVELIISSQGILDRTEEDSANSSTQVTLDGLIDFASAELEVNFAKRYPSTSLTNNRWMRYATSVVTAHMLFSHKGWPIPDSIQIWYERTMKTVSLITSGMMDLPGALPRVEPLPSMANTHVDLGFRINKIRRDQFASVPMSGNYVPGLPILFSNDFPVTLN